MQKDPETHQLDLMERDEPQPGYIEMNPAKGGNLSPVSNNESNNNCWVDLGREIPLINENNRVNLKCHNCNQLVDINPMEYTVIPAPADKNYLYTCENCTTDKKSRLQNLQKTWTEIAMTTIYSLQVRHNRQYFHWKLEISDFVDKNWDQLCQGKKRTQTWWATLQAQITQNTHIFISNTPGSGYWGLRKDYERQGKVYKRTIKRSLSIDKSDDKEHNWEGQETFQSDSWEGSFPQKSLLEKTWERKDLILEFCENSHKTMCCHQCRNRKPTVIDCASCTKRWCEACLLNHYGLDVEEVRRKGTDWNCPYCCASCTCITCRRSRGEVPELVVLELQRSFFDILLQRSPLPQVSRNVERIIAKGSNNKQRMYFVQWRRDCALKQWSWELSKHLANEDLETFAKTPRIILSRKQIEHLKKRKKPRSSPAQVSFQRHRSRDWALDRFIAYDAGPPPTKVEYDISIPPWRECTEENDDGDSSDENTDDEHYSNLHNNFLYEYELNLGRLKSKQRHKGQSKEQSNPASESKPLKCAKPQDDVACGKQTHQHIEEFGHTPN